MSGKKSDSGGWGPRVACFNQGDLTIKVGDCVLLRPSEPSALPYIGKVKDIRKRWKEDIWFQVSWYYRPEETYCGRRVFHGQQEVFESNHVDWQNKKTVLCKCKVHSIGEYQDLSQVTDTDFFTRLAYRPDTKQFEPDIIPVYCKCELPYNPDQFMAQCEKCLDWFHPDCLGMSKEQCDDLRNRAGTGELGDPFFCTDCRNGTHGASRQAPVPPPLPTATRGPPTKKPRVSASGGLGKGVQ